MASRCFTPSAVSFDERLFFAESVDNFAGDASLSAPGDKYGCLGKSSVECQTDSGDLSPKQRRGVVDKKTPQSLQ